MNPLFYAKNGNIINYYRLFKIKPGCSADIVRSRFCELIKKFHPDTAGTVLPLQSEIISTIVNGYRVLSDVNLKKEYDNLLIEDKLNGKTFIIPVSRIKYTFSFSEVLKFSKNRKKISRKDLLKKFGQDVEIFITRPESISGAKAYIELPSRTICPACSGMDTSCYLCNGLGRISSVSVLEVVIPRGIRSGRIFDFDLSSLKPDSVTSFAMKSISVKITIQPI